MVDYEKDLAGLVDDRKLLNFYESTRYVVKRQDGTYHAGHQMCYSGLRSMPKFSSEDYIVNGIQHQTQPYLLVSEENHKFYLDWLMNESPFKDGFLDHNVDWSMENHTTFHHMNQPGNLMLAALSSVRAMSESVSCQGYRYFKPLVDAGCTKEIAFIFMYYLYPTDKDNISVRKFWNDGGHSAWPENSASASTVINFINKKFKNLLADKFFQNQHFDGVHSLFLERNNLGVPNLNTWIISNNKNVVEVTEHNSWGEKVGNSRQLTLPENDMYEYLASLSDRIYKEWIK